MNTLFKRLLHPFIFTLALVLVFEEWLWDGLKLQLHRLSQLPAISAMERGLRKLPPPVALCVMVVPGLALLPFKLLALHLLAHGHPLLGLATLAAAKLTGTALAAYLFDLVRESARRLSWFDRIYVRTMAIFALARNWLRYQSSYLWARRVAAEVRGSLKRVSAQRGVWPRKWAAARLLARRTRRQRET